MNGAACLAPSCCALKQKPVAKAEPCPKSAAHSHKKKDSKTSRSLFVAIAMLMVGGGCRQDMHDQAKHKPLSASAFFADGRSARPVVAGTVARGQLRDDDHLYTGRVNGVYAETYPFPITEPVIRRGQERFNIFCAPCHDALGTGQGMIVQRGFRPPPSLHEQRLRDAPPGMFFDVITNGFGVMWSYADRVAPEDRWAIAAYIKALQLSQNAKLADVDAAQRQKLESALKVSSDPAASGNSGAPHGH